ncbi:N-acetylmuramoyl-L-alanine amidase [Candidatus Endowatersipora endosymbiont of Watersipora subatra]|uniref:N-acetylmuramoyl-L-alanine amidase family protein n=1 Tax=Candidatus Endowatersipora endosymbiont of Watersipora subatra TaxID=3077946 RepID=UPI00312C94CF
MKQYIILSFLIIIHLIFGYQITITSAQSKENKGSLISIVLLANLIHDSQRAGYTVDFDSALTSNICHRLIINLPKRIFGLKSNSVYRSSRPVSRINNLIGTERNSRIIIGLRKRVKISNLKKKESKVNKNNHLLIDFVKTSEKEFQEQITTQHKQPNVIPFQSGLRRRVVVIDPGHGGNDGGAIANHNIFEKNITLNFSKKLKEILESIDNFDVFLTRTDDLFVPLRQRIKFAIIKKADLMISVHTDSLNNPSIRGATIYTLSKKGSDSLSRDLTLQENKEDLAIRLALSIHEKDITDILIDLTRRETEVFSKCFAEFLFIKLRNQIHLINNPTRSADFYVLRIPDIPSVLLELGYLSNAEDKKLMTNDMWIQKTARITKEAIQDFFYYVSRNSKDSKNYPQFE